MTELLNLLFDNSRRRISRVSCRFVRGVSGNIRWNNRLIGIRGGRGVGKTTMLLQRLKALSDELSHDEYLYVSLDNLLVNEDQFPELVRLFYVRGGRHLYLDEVHHFSNWSKMLKNFYDDFPDLKIAFTGSSLLNLLDARSDLSRRALMSDMPGLSFREYLAISGVAEIAPVRLADVRTNHQQLAMRILESAQPLRHFTDYLEHGYYPFFTEDPEGYADRVAEIIRYVIGVELPSLRKVDITATAKLRKLLQTVSSSAPFIPNVSKLASLVGITRNTSVTYLQDLHDAGLLNLMYRDASGITRLRKPDKLYLENPNLLQILVGGNHNLGAMRETFFFNQLAAAGHRVEFSAQSDFLIDGQFTFEVGGRSKDTHQIQNLKNAYLAIDNIETGTGNRIPLWLFGFLY